MPDILETLSGLQKGLDALNDKVNAATARRNVGAVGGVPGAPGRAPGAVIGEPIMSSRGFSFGKCIAVAAGKMRKEDAKIEMELLDRLKGAHDGYKYEDASSMLVPFAPDLYSDKHMDNATYHEVKSLLVEGTRGADPEEMARWAYGKSAVSPAMSWVDGSVGGSFVGPATFGQPIELLRNKEALMGAGASVIPLGPTGRIQMPRLTAAVQGGWAGENAQQTPTQAKTGLMTLSAKKAIGVVAFPNELLRYGSPATEALVRNDLFKSVSLIADKGLLEGPGSDTQPLGLWTMAQAAGNPFGVGLVTISGNQVVPEQAYDFIAQVETNNGEPTGWIMHPQLKAAFYKSRWTPYSGGTSKGGFLFDMVRGMDGKMSAILSGLPITSTAQVASNLGNGSQTYMICGDFPDYLLGLFGAIEFLATDAGWTLLSSDQTAIRAVLSCDGGPRHAGVFSFPSTVINLNTVA